MAEEFWAFSLAFYERAGVSAACIALQDLYGTDVDVVLYALWCAGRGHLLSEAELGAADAAVAGWRKSVVQPIRRARRALKPPPPGFPAEAAAGLRRDLLAAELAAERMQQGVMEARAAPTGSADPAEAARHNLAVVARAGGIPEEAAPIGALLAAWRA